MFQFYLRQHQIQKNPNLESRRGRWWWLPVTNGFAARALLGGEIPADGAFRRVGNHEISAEVAVETAGAAAAADLEVLGRRSFDKEEEAEGEEEESEDELREGIEIPRQSNFVHLISSNIDLQA